MSSRAQMDACGVLCHLEVHTCSQLGKSLMHPCRRNGRDSPRLCLCQGAAWMSGWHLAQQSAVYRLNDEVERIPVSQSITYSCSRARTCGRRWARVRRMEMKKWFLAFVVFVLRLLCISIRNHKKEVRGTLGQAKVWASVLSFFRGVNISLTLMVSWYSIIKSWICSV